MTNALRPRGHATDEEVAVITALAKEILGAQRGSAATSATTTWRFSGRWFASRGFGVDRRPFD